MLEQLHIKNYALAEELNVEFSGGFNILSGETGSGKSVIIGALNLVLGEKGDVSVIRTGASSTEVSAVINITGNSEAVKWLSEHEIPVEDDQLVLRRILKSNGRGSMFIQSVPFTKTEIQEFTSLLFDIHGQHQHQSLLSVDNHRKLLDSFGGLENNAEQLKTDFIELNSIKKEYQKLVENERDLLREADIAAFAVKEIEEAGIKEGEFEELEREQMLLSQAEKIFMLIEGVHDNLSESEGGALGGLRSSMRQLKQLGDIDRVFEENSSRIENVFYETEDVLDSIERYKEQFDYSPERLAACEERLAELLRLRKKYGDTAGEILDFLEQSRKKVDSVENREELKAGFSEKIKALEKSVLNQAAELSKARRQHAAKLQDEIKKQLMQLGMPKADFKVSVEKKTGENGKPSCGMNGFDTVEFLISPNLGEPVKKLKSIASGGEISRVMLAIKTVLAENDNVDCLVFDEIDSGIGGEIAVAVGGHMYNLSKYKQILCITHLASIAVRADNHIRVNKISDGDRTLTEINIISGEERTKEIARMLSGNTDADVSLKHAEELLANASRNAGG